MRANPTLMVVGNPPRRRNAAEALPEGRTLGKAIQLLENVEAKTLQGTRDLIAALDLLSQLQRQTAKGIHRNPAGEQLARKVLRLDYVHAEDGQEYTHDFAEDASTVTATVVEDGRKVILKAVDGRKIVKDF